MEFKENVEQYTEGGDGQVTEFLNDHNNFYSN